MQNKLGKPVRNQLYINLNINTPVYLQLYSPLRNKLYDSLSVQLYLKLNDQEINWASNNGTIKSPTGISFVERIA